VPTALGLASCRPDQRVNEASAGVHLPLQPDTVTYDIDDSASEVLLYVYKEGLMASLGHNHVIALHGLQGEAQWHADAARRRFVLQFPAAAMSVDDPPRRVEAGEDFASVLDEAARSGTRDHMLGDKLLQVLRFPTIELRSEQSSAAAATAEESVANFRVLARVRNRESHFDVPMKLKREGATLTASGNLSLLQTALGLAPYGTALGTLRVRDQIDVKFRIVAHLRSASGTQ
jgi:hypothetical protein